MTKIAPQAEGLPPVVVSHVADFYRRYPGERVTFYTRVDVRQPLSGLDVRVTLGAGLLPQAARVLNGPQSPAEDRSGWLEVEPDQGLSHFLWQIPGEIPSGTRYEYQVRAQVAPTQSDTRLESVAAVSASNGASDSAESGVTDLDPNQSEKVTVAVSAQGRYLDHLPALYREDDLMGRFLMLFESFWAPIERQINQISYYFDPQIAPPDFLHWLASWFDLSLNERWPEQARRRLVSSVISLYRKRGTRRGLLEFLEIFSGTQVQIIEHRARNFRLGSDAFLGPGIALGRDNTPHTFTVVVRLPPLAASDEHERKRKELERRRIIQAIVEAEKPAFTGYNLRLEINPDLEPVEL